MNLTNVQKGLTRSLSRGGLQLQKYSPEILLGAGLFGGVLAAIMAAKATLKAPTILVEAKDELEIIKSEQEHETRRTGGTFTEEDGTKAKAILYVQTGLKFAQLYGPSVGLGVLSIGCILGSHRIMHRRQVSLIAAFNLVQEGFQAYRKRVIEELGEDADNQFRLGVREEEYTENGTDEEGKKTKTKKKKLVPTAEGPSMYAKAFDESSVYFQKDPTLNLVFLRAQQNYWNDRLIAYGHVFLNEVYDSLGIPRTEPGAVVGWVLDNSEIGGDKYIDFNIFNVNNDASRDFLNGWTNRVLLDFNVNGVIYDKI